MSSGEWVHAGHVDALSGTGTNPGSDMLCLNYIRERYEGESSDIRRNQVIRMWKHYLVTGLGLSSQAAPVDLCQSRPKQALEGLMRDQPR